jgi:hypothetical protein
MADVSEADFRRFLVEEREQRRRERSLGAVIERERNRPTTTDQEFWQALVERTSRHRAASRATPKPWRRKR